jgi:propionyl-CoA carboxylase alpha chain
LEIRVYAEDPANNFLPDIGNLSVYQLPIGNGVRVDGGFEEGMDIPIYYDPMLSKLIVHAEDRQSAIDKMIRAIDDYQIAGIETTLSFCRFALQHEAFVSGNFDTNFVKHYFKPEMLDRPATAEELEIAALFAAWDRDQKQSTTPAPIQAGTSRSAWKERRYN